MRLPEPVRAEVIRVGNDFETSFSSGVEVRCRGEAMFDSDAYTGAGFGEGEADAPARLEKNPFFAATLSFLFAGLGQVYNGQLVKGFLVLFGTLIGCVVMLLPGLIVWLYGVYDAYSTARRMNAGTIVYVEMRWSTVILFLVVWGVAVLGGLAMIAVAALFALGPGTMA
jgi:TM2 domain-containing membrane protein YozV